MGGSEELIPKAGAGRMAAYADFAFFAALYLSVWIVVAVRGLPIRFYDRGIFGADPACVSMSGSTYVGFLGGRCSCRRSLVRCYGLARRIAAILRCR